MEKKGQVERELEYLEKALDLIQKTHSGETEDAAIVYYNMGSVLIQKNDPIRAVAFYRQALEIRLKIYGKINIFTADTFEGLAVAFGQLSDMKSYNENLNQANEIYALLSERQQNTEKKRNANKY